MKIKLKNTPDQIELIQAMGSKNIETARKAQEVFAAFLGGVVQVVLQQAGTAPLIYTDITFNEDDSPSYPLDLYYNVGTDYVQVWAQTMAGGLPSSTVEGNAEMKISTYRLDSAVNFQKRYARKSRIDVVSKAITRMTQEVLVKQERNAWVVVLKAVAEASTNGLSHVIAATTPNLFQLDDMNRLMTRIRRINVSWAGGTPDSDYSSGMTDLFVSPEIKEQIRSFAYQPMNTRAVPNTDESTVVPLPDSIREEIFRNAGAQEIYGVSIHELLEFGDAQKYNALFKNFYTGSFTAATDQVLFGIDSGREACIRALETDQESHSTFTVVPDDQFLTRSDKTGWVGSLTEGRVVIDSRALTALTV